MHLQKDTDLPDPFMVAVVLYGLVGHFEWPNLRDVDRAAARSEQHGLDPRESGFEILWRKSGKPHPFRSGSGPRGFSGPDGKPVTRLSVSFGEDYVIPNDAVSLRGESGPTLVVLPSIRELLKPLRLVPELNRQLLEPWPHRRGQGEPDLLWASAVRHGLVGGSIARLDVQFPGATIQVTPGQKLAFDGHVPPKYDFRRKTLTVWAPSRVGNVLVPYPTAGCVRQIVARQLLPEPWMRAMLATA